MGGALRAPESRQQLHRSRGCADSDWSAIDATSRVERRSLLTGGSAPSALGVPIFTTLAGINGLVIPIRELFHRSARVMQLDPLSGAQGVLMLTAANEASGTVAVVTGLSWGEVA